MILMTRREAIGLSQVTWPAIVKDAWSIELLRVAAWQHFKCQACLLLVQGKEKEAIIMCWQNTEQKTGNPKNILSKKPFSFHRR